MKRLKLLIIAAVPLVVVVVVRAADPAPLPDSTAADRATVAVTVYNQNLALVRETRTLKLERAGCVQLASCIFIISQEPEQSGRFL